MVWTCSGLPLAHVDIVVIAVLGSLLRLSEELLGLFGELGLQGGIAALGADEFQEVAGGRLGIQGEGILALSRSAGL